MMYRPIIILYCVVQIMVLQTAAQTQTCPTNINYATGDLSNWSASTGLVSGSAKAYPAPNAGLSAVPEFNVSNTGIQVITTSSSDKYGFFPTIPVINGYTYNFSIKLGSDATSYDLHASSQNPGGFTRAVSYTINVPAGASTVPYTMTYAYAMVLENGTHNSNQQPIFKATLSAKDSVITCASPQYYLPTFNNAGTGNGNGSTGATLDTATARINGFTNSPVLFLSHGGQAGNSGQLLQDVWTKGWTEVTFDLSPYRGQQVTITFESDNCAPGAHFAYAYIALRNNCAGLEISGNPKACTNSPLQYSIPGLAAATYSWTVPPGWTIDSGANSNVIKVTPSNISGLIIAREINGCADLRDTLAVTASTPTIAGKVLDNSAVCTGINSTLLTVGGQTGSVLNWLSSTDGVKWTAIVDSTTSYQAQNLTATTQFRALVQNGPTCRADSSAAATVSVSPKSRGGTLDPVLTNFCAGQTVSSLLTLRNRTGSVVNWQSSPDQVNWTGFLPVYTDTAYGVNGLSSTRYFRTVVQSGACPADTSALATITYVDVPFPSAAILPADTVICYGNSVQLTANITTGTSYTWSPVTNLSNRGSGTIPSLPYQITPVARPTSPTNYVLTVSNAGCPNRLNDTFHVGVTTPIIVFAGNDTSVVAGQPLQLKAAVSDSSVNQYLWSPSTNLSFSNIYNPVMTALTETGESITYMVRATNPKGCTGTDDIKVTVYKTAPDIFVPTGFTPNGDGHNDVIRPVYVGIKQVSFFRVYNRWGQLVFSTSEAGKGWDGTIGGVQQAPGTFVFMVEGTDYTGKAIMKKGTVVLIR